MFAPDHPPCFGAAIARAIPEVLAEVPAPLLNPEVEAGDDFPRVSVIIALHGGNEIDLCLKSLEKIQDLIHEVIVVDDASPDDAADRAQKFDFVKLVANEKNLGFAASCNRGFKESSGEVVLLLNSDTQVPKSGFIRLIESLQSSGAVGAAGPFTNNSGYFQKVPLCYEDSVGMEVFANDFAYREVEDEEISMLVGFCMAIRRHVFVEVGMLDENYGLGLYEDNDLCFRIVEKGYKLILSGKAYIHHEGSATLKRSIRTSKISWPQTDNTLRKSFGSISLLALPVTCPHKAWPDRLQP